MNPFAATLITLLTLAGAACRGDAPAPTHRAPQWLLTLSPHSGGGLFAADVADFVYTLTGRRGDVAIREGNVSGPISARTHDVSVELDGLSWLRVVEVEPGDGGGRTTFEVQLGASGRAGRLRGSTRRTDDASTMVVHIDALDIAAAGLEIPVAFTSLAEGTIHGTIEIRIPDLRWSAASASVTLACHDCATGQRSSPVGATELTIPSFTLGDVEMNVDVRDGHGTVSIHSSGDELGLDGDARVTLRDAWTASELSGCLRIAMRDNVRDATAERATRLVGELLGPPPDGPDIELLIAGSVVDGLVRPHPCREQ